MLIYVAGYLVVGFLVAALVRWYEGGPVEIFVLLFAILAWPIFVVAFFIIEVGPAVSEFMNRKI